MTPSLIRLTPGDAERYMRLRLRMLTTAPWAFSATPEEDEALDPAHLAQLLAQEHHATFAIEAPVPPRLRGETGEEADGRPVLVASASLTRATSPKFSHRARVWGVFVEPAHRGGGLGRTLMHAAIAQARSWRGVDFLDLAVSANSPEARRLYERMGFEAWGREPEATEHEGRRYDEIHMTLRL
jgi:RimJ/RimL family protein N-acetyltransferase